MGCRLAVTLFAVLAMRTAESDLCTDSLDWSPGLHIPYNHRTLYQSISHVGDLRRVRPVLSRLDGESVRVLIIGGSEDTATLCAGCGGHLWQDVFAEWLRTSFPAKVVVYEIYLTGALSRHLNTVPEYAKEKRPDLILVETNLTTSGDGFRATAAAGTTASQEASRVEETFMRSLLELPGQPAVIWMQLISGNHDPNKVKSDSVLTNYYDLPRVSVPGAWKTEIANGDLSHLSRDGHKLIAVTVSNFVCFELLQACSIREPAIQMLPRPLTWQKEENIALEQPGTDLDFGPANTVFCRANKNDKLAGEPSGVLVEKADFPTWSLAAPLVAIPLGIFHVLFVRNGGDYSLKNELPVQMPELELLRVVATLNIVAFQYYQELPPAWARPACDFSEKSEKKPQDTRPAKATLGSGGSAGSKGGDRCLTAFTCSWCRSGRYWFQFYFLLSGFVLALATVRNGPTNAMWQIAQVWPLHALGLLLAVLSLAPLNPVDLVLAVTLMHAWVTPFYSDLNGPSWYLSTLVAFWIFVPVWVRMADTVAHCSGITAVSACLVLVWLCTLVLPIGLFVWPANVSFAEVRNFVEYSPYANWQPFCTGILLACLAMLGVEPATQTQVVAFIFIASVGLCIAWFVIPPSEPEMGLQYLLLDKGFGLQPLFALLVLGCVGSRHVPNAVHEVLSSSTFWMYWSARLCWPVFILHQPVHMFCQRAIFPFVRSQESLSFLCMIIYPIALVLVGAAASQLIDQPWAEFLFKFRKKHFGSKRRGGHRNMSRGHSRSRDENNHFTNNTYSKVPPDSRTPPDSRNNTDLVNNPASVPSAVDNDPEDNAAPNNVRALQVRPY